MSDRRKITRTRTRNFKTPLPEDVEDSIRRIIAYARKWCTRDHDDSFASGKERDLIVTTYLERAKNELQEKIDNDPTSRN